MNIYATRVNQSKLSNGIFSLEGLFKSTSMSSNFAGILHIYAIYHFSICVYLTNMNCYEPCIVITVLLFFNIRRLTNIFMNVYLIIYKR